MKLPTSLISERHHSGSLRNATVQIEPVCVTYARGGAMLVDRRPMPRKVAS
jgi:hypothetical protein